MDESNRVLMVSRNLFSQAAAKEKIVIPIEKKVDAMGMPFQKALSKMVE